MEDSKSKVAELLLPLPHSRTGLQSGTRMGYPPVRMWGMIVLKRGNTCELEVKANVMGEASGQLLISWYLRRGN